MLGLTRSGRIILLLGLNIIMFLAELIVGYKTGSLALIADAFHMLSDVLSQVIALYAIRLAAKTEWQPTLSYGWQRAELLGALYNGVFLLALCFTIFLDAIERFFKPEDIENPKLVLIVGGIGLACNLLGLVLFHDHSGHAHSHGGHSHGHSHSHSKKPKAISNSSVDEPDVAASDNEKGSKRVPHPLRHQSSLERISPLRQANIQNLQQAALEVQHQIESEERYAQQDAEETRSRSRSGTKPSGEDLNMQGIFLHVLGDALGSVGVIFTALFVWLTDFSWRFYMDPIISIFITAIIIHSALPLVRSASFILLQGVPVGVEIEEIRREIKAIPDVISIHDLHIWQLTNIKMVASLHVLVTNQEAFERISRAVKAIMHRAGVHSTTIQPEFPGMHPYHQQLAITRGGLRQRQNLSSDEDGKTLLSSTALTSRAASEAAQSSEYLHDGSRSASPIAGEVVDGVVVPVEGALDESNCALLCVDGEQACDVGSCCTLPVKR
ncbi:hypothetical protein BGZ92_002932 [Podila epicladia]|nr:hypothetical protein BGZ92_002932 [Podila epicladia]